MMDTDTNEPVALGQSLQRVRRQLLRRAAGVILFSVLAGTIWAVALATVYYEWFSTHPWSAVGVSVVLGSLSVNVLYWAHKWLAPGIGKVFAVIFPVLWVVLMIALAVAFIWLLITAIRWFWLHPLF
jgi:hypothetical protein